MHRRAFLAAVSSPFAAACVGVGGNGTTPEGSEGAMSTFPEYEWEKLTRADAADTSRVTMWEGSFRPLVARVPVGVVVTFSNRDAGRHTVTMPAIGVDTTVNPGDEMTMTVDETGGFDYVCRRHPPGMLGRIVVHRSS